MPVAALVRKDGSLTADVRLVRRLRHPGGAVDAGPQAIGIGSDPLWTTLLAARACDSVAAVVLHQVSHRQLSPPLVASARSRHFGNGSEWDPFSIDVTEGGEIHLVRLRGELDVAAATRLEATLIQVAGSTVVVDLTELAFIDAAGLRAIANAKHEIERRGHALTVKGAQGLVRRVFEITELRHLLDD